MPTCTAIDNWCLANERRRTCQLWLPYVVYAWCSDWIARSHPDARYTTGHWPRCLTGRESGPTHLDYVRNRFRFIASMLDEPTPINVARARAAARNHADPFPYGKPPSFRYRAFYWFAKGRVLPWAPGTV